MEDKGKDIPLEQLLEAFRAGRRSAYATARLEEAKAMKCILAPALERVAEAGEKIEGDPRTLDEVSADLNNLVAEARTTRDSDADDPFQATRETGAVELARRTHIDWEQVGQPREES